MYWEGSYRIPRNRSEAKLPLAIQACDNFLDKTYLCEVTTINEIRNTLQSNKQRLTEKYGISMIAIFGSYGRGQQKEDSDIDILVDFQKPIGIEFIDLADELELLLQNKVDLVSLKGVRPQYYKHIENELMYV